MGASAGAGRRAGTQVCRRVHAAGNAAAGTWRAQHSAVRQQRRKGGLQRPPAGQHMVHAPEAAPPASSLSPHMMEKEPSCLRLVELPRDTKEGPST